jgi:serine/threonine protein kinase/DNA-directed RNA polymerase subunit RPC12/RpoP
MISFACSQCGRKLRVQDEQAGKKVRCPHCGALTLIPSLAVSRSKEEGGAAEPRAQPPQQPPDPNATAALVHADKRPDDETLPPAGAEGAPPPLGAPLATVSGYELLEELGRGGMGVVYKARQLRPRRLVALKMILAGEHAGPEALHRFQVEAHAVARLQHPNIVQVYEVSEHNGLPYLTLEYIEGGSLSQRLARKRPTARQTATLLQQLARAVHYAHSKGIIHRDLKPGNILFAPSVDELDSCTVRLPGAGAPKDRPIDSWTPKIVDFGLAKQMEGMTSFVASGPRTQTGAILGTPSYMAPEQAGGKSKQIGPAADVYSLGAILYECLTGEPPFRGESMLDTLMQVAMEEPVPPSQLRRKCSPDLEAIALKCLQKDPADRYESALALAEDLGRFLDKEPVEARPPSALQRLAGWFREHKRMVLGAGAGLLALCLVLLIVLLRKPSAERLPRQTSDEELPGKSSDEGPGQSPENPPAAGTSLPQEKPCKELFRRLFPDEVTDAQVDKFVVTYRVRLIVKPVFQTNEDFLLRLALIGAERAHEVFGTAPVDFHVCDEKLKTVHVVERFRSLPANGGTFYYDSRVSIAEVEKLRDLFLKEGWHGKSPILDGSRKTFLLQAKEKRYELRMPIPPLGVNLSPAQVKRLAQDISAKALGSARLRLILWDDNFETKDGVMIP